jgi:hypothetical protein
VCVFKRQLEKRVEERDGARIYRALLGGGRKHVRMKEEEKS